jgi:hypothetical protein
VCVCVCVCVCVYYVCVCVYACMHACMHVCLYICIFSKSYDHACSTRICMIEGTAFCLQDYWVWTLDRQSMKCPAEAREEEALGLLVF